MKYQILSFILVAAILSNFVSAGSTITIGEHTIDYDEFLQSDTDNNGMNDRQSYYKNDALVFTAYDRNEDGKPDLWFRYDDELRLDLEIVDQNKDGTPDEFHQFDVNENIIELPKSSGDNMILIVVVIIIIIILGLTWWKKSN